VLFGIDVWAMSCNFAHCIDVSSLSGWLMKAVDDSGIMMWDSV